MSPPKKTADLYDLHGDRLAVADPVFRDFGGHPAFDGTIETLKLYEDNTLVSAALAEPGAGRVLVVDGAGSLRYALVGDRLAQLGVDNGWRGLVIYGCVRDSDILCAMPLGIRALAATPRKTEKRNVGERGRPVTFAGITFTPGHHLYADEDGIVVADRPL